MIRSALIKKLNDMAWLQFIFVALPVILITVYIFAYMTDMLGVYRVLAYNDRLSEQNLSEGELHEVTFFEQTDENSYKVVVNGNSSSEEEVGVDEAIFYIQMVTPEWYRLVTKSQSLMYMTKCSLFEVEDLGDGVANISIADQDWDVGYGDIICFVSIDGDGLYKITFLNENEYSYTLDSLYMTELLLNNQGVYRVRVTSSYELEANDIDVSFCTNLPTNSVYYNESTQTFVKNISPDYGITFIVRSNLIVVLLSTLLYWFLLSRINKEQKLTLMEGGHIMRVNAFAICLLPICAIFTLMLL